MLNKLLHICILMLFVSGGLFGQESIGPINVQGQIANSPFAERDFEFVVIGIGADTIWKEKHENITLDDQGSFSLALGNGEYISGSSVSFQEINWLDATRFEIYQTRGERYLQGAFQMQSVPYAMHSIYLLNAPNLNHLSDVDDSGTVGNQLEFDGINFIMGTDNTGDSALYVWNAEHVDHVDTALFAFNDEFADTAYYTFLSDSGNYALDFLSVLTTNTATRADSSAIALESIGNWGLSGNELGDTDKSLGAGSDKNFYFTTNSHRRLLFDTDGNVNNGSEGNGFRLNAKKGILYQTNDNPGLTEIDGSYLYFDGETNSLHGGTSTNPIDTLKGIYSFAWGENVGTNGPNSTVFGKETYGDTALFGGALTPFASISSFAAGRKCHVAHMSFAIGDSCIADYYRNIAVGRKAVSTTASAGLAMGNNVLVEGATSWAMGHNVQATGHFSTALGTNASTNNFRGGFVYGDNSTTDTVKNTAKDQFMVRAAGGYIFYSSSDLTMGVELAPGGGSWSMISDRTKKRNITRLAPLSYNKMFDTLQVFSWEYKGQTTAHIGPMAQDIYGIFDVGEVPHYINMIDNDGIAFLGIKMLNEKVNNLSTIEDLDEKANEIEREKESLEEMERRINLLYEELDNN